MNGFVSSSFCCQAAAATAAKVGKVALDGGIDAVRLTADVAGGGISREVSKEKRKKDGDGFGQGWTGGKANSGKVDAGERERGSGRHTHWMQHDCEMQLNSNGT